MARPLEEISKDYKQQALYAGDTAYRLHVLQDDLKRMHEKMKELNMEARQVQEAEAAMDAEAVGTPKEASNESSEQK